ncbi:MAG TPA: MbnP family protein [Polyangia bacterium]|nr:MbnP family protein [Polyangia bacterium]
MTRFDRRSVPLIVATVVAAVLGAVGLGCAGSSSARPGAGGGGSEGAARDGGAGATGGATADGASAKACPVSPTQLRKAGAALSLSVAPILEGKPFVFGDANALASGVKVTPLNFRFYVSHVSLLQPGGASVPVDLVTATGAVEPYGVHLFNAEEAASAVLRVLAPAGTYAGLTFTLGLDDACNSGLPGDRMPPLTDTSQMTWPHEIGYLFLRLEDRLDTSGAADAGAIAIPTLVHMGGVPGNLFAPTVTVGGALALAAGATTAKTLTLDVGAVFAGAEADVDPATLAMVLPFPEVQAGERLRQHVSQLALFALAP